MTRFLRTATLLAAVALLVACGGGEGSIAPPTTAVPPTTAAARTTTTTTAAPASTITTTLPPSTTTTIPTAHIKIEVAVYDGWFDSHGAYTDYCLTRPEFNGVDFSWVGKDRNVLLTDATADEVLAVALLGAGTVEVDEDGYEYCMFRGTFQNVPLDRPLYAYTLEGEHWGGVETVDASELADGTLGMVYSEPEEQKKREAARGD